MTYGIHMIQLNLSSGELIRLKSGPARKFRGTKIPGGVLTQSVWDKYEIYNHEFRQSGYCISHRSFHFMEECKLIIAEKIKWLRLETVLSGELQVLDTTGKIIHLLPGQYHITDTPVFQMQFNKDQGCSYFSAYYSPEFLAGLGLPTTVSPVSPRPIPKAMKEIIDKMLDNPFDNELRPFYYSNCIRDILFTHVTSPPYALPGGLTEKQVALIYEVDRFMAANLDEKITIRALVKRFGTNSFFLKKAYELVFDVGIFPRLVQRKMERAKFLLEKTEKPLKDICELSGYETLSGFITEFRKHFDVTPHEWRKGRRGL